MNAPVITFLSDYGLIDEFVGVCHGVIATICPRARVIDLTHGVPRHDVRAGALTLRAALPFTPVGVHLAVVDPDVGSSRRAVALLTADDRLMVGPDNGLLSLAAAAAGGVVAMVELTHSPFCRQPVSATFHGRDVFAPVAARLAAGAALADAGDPCDPAELVTLELPVAEIRDRELIAHAVGVDHFGNVQLNVDHEGVAAVGLTYGRAVDVLGAGARFVRTFADVPAGDLLLYEDATGRLTIAVSRGSAAERLGLWIDCEVRIRVP
jgi:S-adenosylmethionine hydrolase